MNTEHFDIKKIDKSKHTTSWGMISFFTSTYILILFLQANGLFNTIANGILAQLLVIISILLVTLCGRTGFIVGLLLNGLNLISIFIALFIEHITEAYTGLVVNLFTIISISIIGVLTSRNTRQYANVVKQKQEMAALNEEISASEEELRQQHKKLLKYYKIIKENEEKLNHLAYFDTLTELPNRKMILDRLDLLVRLSSKISSPFAVVFIDLDNFKKINDTLGHHSGDLLILSVASRLNSLVHPSDLLGRLGGDEFALVIQQNLSEEETLAYVEKLRNSLEKVFLVEESEILIRASFGISMFPKDGTSRIDLIKCADTAMYKAKEMGKNGICFFREEMQSEILRKIDFEKKLISAFNNEEFFLVFQPQFVISSGKLRGFEALIRWQSPDWGMMSPLKFMPLVEEMGLIVPLGEWILRTACQKFKHMVDHHQIEDAIISVNISVAQLEAPDFVPMVSHILQECGLKANCLEIEITESVLIKSFEHAIQILKQLKALGILIALDDFGTGYSSLRYLQLLPIDTLKIDKSFVDNIDNPDENKQIVGSIISLVQRIGVSVVAEGVESETQLDYLRSAHCDNVQGFLLGHPLNDIEVEAFFAQYSG